MADARAILDRLMTPSDGARGMTISAIAIEVGVSRTTLSLYISEKYPSPVEGIEAAIVERYNRIACPHLVRELRVPECRAFATRACPTSSVREVRHWKACQACEHKPSQGEKS